MKAYQGAFKAPGAFQAAARPLCAGAVCRQPRAPVVQAVAANAGAGAATPAPERPSLAELAEGPYFVLALLLDAQTLCATDASCRLLRQLNRACIGPWRALGATVFHGLELEREGVFEQPASSTGQRSGGQESGSDSERGHGNGGGRKLARIDWKGRFHHFRTDVPTFCAPFSGPEIGTVAHPDEVAYFRCRLCTDVLGDKTLQRGVYFEVEVLANPDNLSFAVVDFEAGGCSSVTFSPDTGAVIRERKVREAPRKVEGAYIQPLPTVPPGKRFHGLMGLYLHKGRLAFFRRCDVSETGTDKLGTDAAAAALQGDGPEQPAAAGDAVAPAEAGGAAAPVGAASVPPSLGGPEPLVAAATPGVWHANGTNGATGSSIQMQLGPWETTGFVSDLGWAEGQRLTPCLAFRDEGAYRVRVVRVGSEPPLPQARWNVPDSSDGIVAWSGFDWEVGATAGADAAMEPGAAPANA